VDALLVDGGVLVQEVRRQQRDVTLALSQRRQLHRHHVDPVEQVLAEPALLHGGAQVAVGRGHDAQVDLDGLVAAHPLELALLQEAEQLDLGRRRDLADLVEEQRAAVGLVKPPLAPRRRAGERAALVTEQLALEQRLGERGAVQTDERTGGAGGVAVEGRRDQLLAGAALAADEHRRARRRDLQDRVEHRAHGRARSDDVVEAIRVGQELGGTAGHSPDAPALEHRLDHPEQILDVDRLGHVVDRAVAHRGHGGVERAVRRHDHGHAVRVELARPPHERQAVHPGHPQIGEQQIGSELLELRERLETVTGRLHHVPSVAQQLRQRRAGVGLVVDNQDPPALPSPTRW
jgi:hypothetical protein